MYSIGEADRYLNEEEVHDDKLHGDPNHIKEVVLPCKSVDAKRVDVRVERAGGAGDQPEKSDAFGADREGEDFDDWSGG